MTLTLDLPPEVEATLQEEADRQGISLSDLAVSTLLPHVAIKEILSESWISKTNTPHAFDPTITAYIYLTLVFSEEENRHERGIVGNDDEQMLMFWEMTREKIYQRTETARLQSQPSLASRYYETVKDLYRRVHIHRFPEKNLLKAIQEIKRGIQGHEEQQPQNPTAAAQSTSPDQGKMFLSMLQANAPKIAAGTLRPITSADISQAIEDSRP